MNKQRKICCRITPGRVMGTIVVAVSAVNLIIVGAAFEVTFPDPAPTSTVTLLLETVMGTHFPVTAAGEETSTTRPLSTATATQTSTSTPTMTFTPTSTITASHTSTATPSPTRISCVPRTYWPVYVVRRGDTMFGLAIATGSTVYELMLANCMPDTDLIAGEPLYVPRLPIPTATATPTATVQTIIPSWTATGTTTYTPPTIGPNSPVTATPIFPNPTVAPGLIPIDVPAIQSTIN